MDRILQKYNGLISEFQKPVHVELPYWQYGTIVDGVKKVDPMLHFGCFSLGYTQPALVKRVYDVVNNIKPEMAETLVPREPLYLNQVVFELQDKLYDMTGYNSFYCLSGSDANEGAIKLASAYHHAQGNTDKKYIVSLRDSYHGSTFMSSTIGHKNLMQDPFYNLLKYEGVKHVHRNFDIDQDWSEVAAFVVETCTYGNGMTPFTDEFWSKLQHLQEHENVLIIIDDIFMGGGKTGNWVGWKHLPIQPDIFTQGKSITAGFFPLSITYYSDKIKQNLPENFRWDHGFTYNFSIPGIVSVLENIRIIEEGNLLENIPAINTRALELFKAKRYKVINTFGLTYMVAQRYATMFILPLNPTEEYWKALEDTL